LATIAYSPRRRPSVPRTRANCRHRLPFLPAKLPGPWSFWFDATRARLKLADRRSAETVECRESTAKRRFELQYRLRRGVALNPRHPSLLRSHQCFSRCTWRHTPQHFPWQGQSLPFEPGIFSLLARLADRQGGSV